MRAIRGLLAAAGVALALPGIAAAQTSAYPPAGYSPLLFDSADTKYVFRLNGAPWICRGDTFCKPIKIEGVADKDLAQATIESLGVRRPALFPVLQAGQFREGQGSRPRPAPRSAAASSMRSSGDVSPLGTYQVKQGDRVVTRTALLRQVEAKNGRAQLLWCTENDCSELPLTRDAELYLASMGSGRNDGRAVAWLRDKSGAVLSCAQPEEGVSDQLACEKTKIVLGDFPATVAAPAPAPAPAPAARADHVGRRPQRPLGRHRSGHHDRRLRQRRPPAGRCHATLCRQRRLAAAAAEARQGPRRSRRAIAPGRGPPVDRRGAALRPGWRLHPCRGDAARRRQAGPRLRGDRAGARRNRVVAHHARPALPRALPVHCRDRPGLGGRAALGSRAPARRLCPTLQPGRRIPHESRPAWRRCARPGRIRRGSTRRAPTSPRRGRPWTATTSPRPTGNWRSPTGPPRAFPRSRRRGPTSAVAALAPRQQPDDLRLLLGIIDVAFQRKQYDDAERLIADGTKRYPVVRRLERSVPPSGRRPTRPRPRRRQPHRATRRLCPRAWWRSRRLSSPPRPAPRRCARPASRAAARPSRRHARAGSPSPRP